MPKNIFCEQLISSLSIIKVGFLAPLENIEEKHLNYIFADHKMTIGQIAVHSGAWAQYHVAPMDRKPWTPVKWTCIKCDYPLTQNFVMKTIDNGFSALLNTLDNIDDGSLEITTNGDKGPGYIIYRLLLHFLSHANQMSYLRSFLDPHWDWGGHFGNMATSLIKINYGTDRDLRIQGF